MTLQEKYIESLKFLGYKQVVNSRSRRVVFESPRKPGTYWYLGKSGAIRIGITIAKSLPASLTIKKYLLTARTLRAQVQTGLDRENYWPIVDTYEAIYAIAAQLSTTIPEDIRILIMHVRAIVQERANGDQN